MLVVMLVVAVGGCAERVPRIRGGPPAASRAQQEQATAGAELSRLEHQHLRWPEDRDRFTAAARTAWTYVEGGYQPATGFVSAAGNFPLATVWDIGSMLAALYSARGLGFIDAAFYQARLERLLDTLARVELYEHRAFNKAYDVQTGAMVYDAVAGRPHQWAGWSSIDLGRLLIWLKIATGDTALAAKAEGIVRRNDFSRIIRSGYLWGQDIDPEGRPRAYQEGRIGYEQYAALGFALWGYRADKALSLTENALPITVMGQRLVTDVRRWDRLTSEPFLLWGLEVGWAPQTAALVRRLLRAQETRYRKTGFLTIAGEDSLPHPPHYFYYYCVHANGRDFALDVQDRQAVADDPRWISAKSAFAFHALMPTRYTEIVLEALEAARGPAGWASGVYEASGRSTGGININTAAAILAAALVDRHGEPLLAQARRASHTGDQESSQ
jgi:hypothetical protein